MDVYGLAQQCASDVAPSTVAAIVSVESSRNPYAIGVVGGHLPRQPRTLEEALTAVQALEAQGRNFSVGLAQVNRYNLPKYRVSYRQAFDPCTNLRVGSQILKECYMRASGREGDPQRALRAAFSCYYSGNFTRGFRPDKPGEPSYVDKVVAAAGKPASRLPTVPAVEWTVVETAAAGTAATSAPKASETPTILIAQHRDGVADLSTDALASTSAKSSVEERQPGRTGDSAVVF